MQGSRRWTGADEPRWKADKMAAEGHASCHESFLRNIRKVELVGLTKAVCARLAACTGKLSAGGGRQHQLRRGWLNDRLAAGISHLHLIAGN